MEYFMEVSKDARRQHFFEVCQFHLFVVTVWIDYNAEICNVY